MTADEKPPRLPENDARRLARLAQVPDTAFGRYYELLTWQLEEAYLANLYLGRAAASERIRTSDIDDYLSRLQTAAPELDAILAAASLGEEASAAVAGSLLEETLATGDATGFGARVSAYRHSLMALTKAAGEASKLANDRFPPKRTRGAPGDSNLPFDNFVKRLYETAEMTGRQLPRWYFKTVIQALDLLRPYLPKSDFFPKGDLGLRLERRASSAKIS